MTIQFYFESRHKTSLASGEYFASAQQSLVEGVNSPSRGAAVYSPGPIFLESGRGSHVWDLDGNEYVDFMMSFGAPSKATRIRRLSK